LSEPRAIQRSIKIFLLGVGINPYTRIPPLISQDARHNRHGILDTLLVNYYNGMRLVIRAIMAPKALALSPALSDRAPPLWLPSSLLIRNGRVARRDEVNQGYLRQGYLHGYLGTFWDVGGYIG
jgi:hypothetical protein